MQSLRKSTLFQLSYLWLEVLETSVCKTLNPVALNLKVLMGPTKPQAFSSTASLRPQLLLACGQFQTYDAANVVSSKTGTSFDWQVIHTRNWGSKSSTKSAKQFIRNEDITAPELRVVFQDGEHKVMTREEALTYVHQQSLDLILVNNDTVPPVAKVVEFNKFQHGRQQKERKIASETRSRGRLNVPKEVRVRPRISDNDLQQKLKKIKEFLTKGHKVTMVVMYKGDQEVKMAQEALHYIVRMVEESHQVVVETAPVNASRRSSVATLIIPQSESGVAKSDGDKPTKDTPADATLSATGAKMTGSIQEEGH